MFDADGVEGIPPDVAADPGAIGLVAALDAADRAALRSGFPAPGVQAEQWAAFVAAESIDLAGPDEPDQPAATAPPSTPQPATAADTPPSEIDTVRPGVELAGLLDAIPLKTLRADDVVDVATGWHRVIAWATAQRASAIAELTRRPEMSPAASAPRRGSVHPVSITGDEIAVPLTLTTTQAENLTGRSVALIEDFPDSHTALAAGRLDENRARIILDELTPHETRIRDLVQAAILPHMHGWDSTMLRRSIRAILHELAPDTMAERRERAAQNRYVKITPAPDGMAYLDAFLPAEDAIAIKTVLDAAARTMRDHDRAARAHTAHSTATASTRPTDGSRSGHDSGDDDHSRPSEDPDPGPAGDPGSASGATPDGAGGSNPDSPLDPPKADTPGSHPPPQSGAYGTDGPERTNTGRVRTLDQCRADALAAIAWHALRRGHLHDTEPVNLHNNDTTRDNSTHHARCGTPLAGQGRRPVRVNVTIPITALLGLTNTPGELEGYGPIPAHIARRLAVDGTWRRLLTDPAEHTLLNYGRTRYTPPADLAEHVRARDRECVMPGCHTPALGCHLDHTIAYPAGTTSADNLSPLCHHHHLTKHHTGWRITQPRPGTFTWTSPTGRQHTIQTHRRQAS